MWPYWLMFLLPAAAAVLTAEQRYLAGRWTDRGQGRWGLGWWGVALVVTLLVGYRVQVGGDWQSYIGYLDRVRGTTLGEVLAMPDPGYLLLNWLVHESGGGIVWVNLISGALFASGLVSFCRRLPRPWLALAVAVPYLGIVLGMGYSRQGIALGLSMLGLVALQRESTLKFVVWVLLGATFHKTAVLLLPIAALASTRNRYWTATWVGVVTLLAYGLFLEESVETLVAGYIEAAYQSEGAMVRLLMNALPASFLLLRWGRFHFAPTEGALWRWMALISLGLLVVLFVSPSSTAVDRVALYMLPLQLVVFSRLPEVMGQRGLNNQGWAAMVVAYYAAVLFVWLNYSTHAQYWLPYRFYPFE